MNNEITIHVQLDPEAKADIQRFCKLAKKLLKMQAFAIWQCERFALNERYRMAYEDDLPHFCMTCGSEMQIVRPGKWQCNECG